KYQVTRVMTGATPIYPRTGDLRRGRAWSSGRRGGAPGADARGHRRHARRRRPAVLLATPGHRGRSPPFVRGGTPPWYLVPGRVRGPPGLRRQLAGQLAADARRCRCGALEPGPGRRGCAALRSEEHTYELQSREKLVS